MALTNWAGNVRFSTDRLHHPSSVPELQELVARTPRIRALGTGHSFNRIADTDGDLVSVSGLGIPIEIDAMTRTVDVGAGSRYGELTSALQAAGWALPNLGSLPHISVAGAAATGTHGSGNANACLAASAVAIEFVQGGGELVEVSREDPGFAGTVLALGALGIVTRLRVAIQASYQLRQDVWLDAPLTTVVDRLDEIMAAGYSVSIFTGFSRPEIVDQIWVKSRVDPDGRAGEVPDGRAWGARAATSPRHPTIGQDPRATTEQLGVPGPWNERLPHFRLAFTPSTGEEQQSEYLVDREHGAAALATLWSLGLGDVVQAAEVRSVAADDLWLSPFRERDCLALHFTWRNDDALVAAAVTAVERALAPFDARPHWGKIFHAAPRPAGLDAFRALAAEHDPNRRFGNTFLERYVYA